MAGAQAECDARLDLARKTPAKPGVEEMLAMLDGALTTLDGIGEGEDAITRSSSQ